LAIYFVPAGAKTDLSQKRQKALVQAACEQYGGLNVSAQKLS
jgi:hypothetical protein